MKERTSLHPFGHGGDLQTAAQAYGFDPEEIIDFSANINPLGQPPGLLAYVANNLDAVSTYPDPACRKLCATIKRRYQPRHSIIVGNGAGELIYLLMRTLPDGPVLLAAPTFTLYEKAANAAGRAARYHQLQHAAHFALQIDDFCSQIVRERPALVMLCNPNNPTGAGATRADVLTVSEACAQVGAYLIVDEAFLEFHPQWHSRTLLTEAPDNVLVLCSMTKMYAIPGLRLGFLAAPDAVCAAMQNLKDPWSVNALAQLAGEFVLRDEHFINQTVETITQLAHDFYTALQAIPSIRPYRPTANYIFIESATTPSQVLQHQLMAQKILVRDCGSYAGLEKRYVRVAVRSHAHNAALIDALNTLK
ncbi:MAG: threonine-phosphate decarboxylase CobD [Firmicutes bacterium]|nr:threonine-phosphate decarboxylase CobD [Bacillota bacterium]